MKRLLVLADLFPPAFAPRIAYLCKYLPQFDWDPYVITEELPPAYVNRKSAHGNVFASFESHLPVTRIDLTGQTMHSLRFAKELLFESKEKLFYKQAKPLATELKPHAILALAYRKFPFATAERLASELSIPWIADCRDIIEQYPGNSFLPSDVSAAGPFKNLLLSRLKRRFITLRNRRIEHANMLVTVSPWHQEQLSHVNPRCELIYNGFDPELFYPQHQKTEQFIICFAGRLMSLEMRDPSMLIEALNAPELQAIRQEKKIELHFYVDDMSRQILQKLMDAAGLSELTQFKPMVPAMQLPSVLSQASIILHLSNKETTKGPHGIVSTKLFEALAMEKPLLMLRSDEAIGEQIIQTSRAGLAARHTKQVIDYIVQNYAQWKQEGYTHLSNYDRAFVAQYSRIEQAKQYASLFDHLTQ